MDRRAARVHVSRRAGTGREPVLAVTWRPFPGSYRGRVADAVAASPAVTSDRQ